MGWYSRGQNGSRPCARGKGERDGAAGWEAVPTMGRRDGYIAVLLPSLSTALGSVQQRIACGGGSAGHYAAVPSRRGRPVSRLLHAQGCAAGTEACLSRGGRAPPVAPASQSELLWDGRGWQGPGRSLNLGCTPGRERNGRSSKQPSPPAGRCQTGMLPPAFSMPGIGMPGQRPRRLTLVTSTVACTPLTPPAPALPRSTTCG